MDESWVIPSACNDFFDTVILAKSFCTADEFDLDAVFFGETLGVGSDFVTQRLGEAREIKDLDVVLIKIEAHPVGMTPAGNCTGYYNAVEARETSGDLLGVTIL